MRRVILKKKIVKAVAIMPKRERILSYHWVACWIETIEGIELEVTYVGSRENAPY